MKEIARLARPEIYAMKPYSSARTEGSARALIYLDANENPYPPYPGTADLIGLNRYPEPQPQKLLDRFAEIYGVDRDYLFMARGADESIDLLVRAFCAAGKDGILVTPPTFVMYETAADIQGAAVHRVPLDDEFQLDVDGMLAMHAQNPSTKIVFTCSPGNPTSKLLRRTDILRLADDLFGRALVVVDELYVDYSGQPSLANEIGEHPNLVVLRSMSKEYSLAGERVGITIAHPEVIGILGRIMAPYSLSVTAVRAVEAAVTEEGREYGRANIRRILEERERVTIALAKSPAVSKIFPSDANFLLFQTSDIKVLVKTMETAGIKVRDRSNIVENGCRLGIGTPEENTRMLEVFAEYEKLVTG